MTDPQILRRRLAWLLTDFEYYQRNHPGYSDSDGSWDAKGLIEDLRARLFDEQPAIEPGSLVSFDAEKGSRYILKALLTFLNDPAETEYQRGYLAALLVVYREGLGKGVSDSRIAALVRTTELPL